MDYSQPELAAVNLREARRSDPTIPGRIGHVPTRVQRQSVHATTSENVGIGITGRRSPRLASHSQCLGASRLSRTSAGTRTGGGGALNDITNVTASRATQPSQAYGKAKQSVVAEASTSTSERAPSLAQTHSNENPQSVFEYASEIYANSFRDEALFLARPKYMDSQTDINGKMRAILIDWLVEVHLKYKMRSETLFLTVNLIDRYLSRAQVVRKRLQLVGVVAMFVASKFEEISPPDLKDFVHITDNAYTKDEVLGMECSMLTTLNFQIVAPLATLFFEKLQRVNRCDQVHVQLAEYMIELGLLDLRMLNYAPSHIVSASLLLSNELLGKRPLWSPAMVKQSRQTEQALHDCVELLRELLEAAPRNQLQAVRKKFTMPHFHSVARMNFTATTN